MKKRDLTTILTSLIVAGIFVFTAPLLNSCGGSECDHDHDTIACNDSLKASHDCEHHKAEHKCNHHKNDSVKCCSHGEKGHGCCDMAKLKEERIAFDEKLTAEEKTEIERIKEIFSAIEHDSVKCTEIQEKYANEIASLQSIVDAHEEDFKAICEIKHEGDKEHKCKEMTEEEMKEHCNQFKIHFLLMCTADKSEDHKCKHAESTEEVTE